MAFPLHDDRTESAVLGSMVLLATLSTVAEVWHAVRERRAGRDPSEQESPAVALPSLRAARRELGERALRLQASLACTPAEAEAHLPRLVRRFDDLMTLRRVGRLLQRIHQCLLSLYPGVSEDLVEEVRYLEARCREVEAEGEAVSWTALDTFTVDLFDLVHRLGAEVGGGPSDGVE